MKRNFAIHFLNIDGTPVASINPDGTPARDENGNIQPIKVSTVIIRALQNPKQGLSWTEQKQRNDLAEKLFAGENPSTAEEEAKLRDFTKVDIDLIQSVVTDWGNPRLTGVVARIIETDPETASTKAEKAKAKAA